LSAYDQWKENLLCFIAAERTEFYVNIDGKKQHYIVTAVPFYNSEDENKFREELKAVLG
jgi:hypothetical protein